MCCRYETSASVRVIEGWFTHLSFTFIIFQTLLQFHMCTGPCVSSLQQLAVFSSAVQPQCREWRDRCEDGVLFRELAGEALFRLPNVHTTARRKDGVHQSDRTHGETLKVLYRTQFSTGNSSPFCPLLSTFRHKLSSILSVRKTFMS